MRLNPRKTTKFVVRLIVGGAASSTVKHLIDQNTEIDEDSRLDSAKHLVGVGILGWMVQDYVGRYTDTILDDVFEAKDEIVKTWKNQDK